MLIGAAAEETLHQGILTRCPEAVGLAGKTTLLDLAALARGALVAVGNDTGPMHLAAAAGCPSVVLYSRESDPALCGQRGESVRYIRQPSLSDVGVDDVVDVVTDRIARHLEDTGPDPSGDSKDRGPGGFEQPA